MKTSLVLLATIALSSVSLAAPPAAPVVTVGGSNIKQLQFDWPAVPGAARYELWYLVGAGGTWVKYTETPAQRPIIRIGVSAHLLVWPTARYRVAACNPSGCTNSAEVGVETLANDVTGFLKPNFEGEAFWFGNGVALSADGLTAAVGLGYTAGRNYANGSVYVYRKANPLAAWKYETRLMPNLFRGSSAQPYASRTISINGDGTLIAFGRPEGIAGADFSGAVYLFRRNGTTWTQERRWATGLDHDGFGNIVDLDDSGNTLAVWHQARTASGTGWGATEIYTRTSAGWQLASTISSPVPSGGYTYCGNQALSGDGKTLFRTCESQGNYVVLVHKAPDWAESARLNAGGGVSHIATNFDGTLFATRGLAGLVDVYRLQQNVWSPDASSPLSLTGDPADVLHLESTIAMSGDGRFIAIGDSQDEHGTLGSNYPPIRSETGQVRGSVFVFERKSAGWKLRRLVKPSVAPVSSSTGYGDSVALSGNAHEMIVGSAFDRSGATGMHGDPANTSTTINLGAAWLY